MMDRPVFLIGAARSGTKFLRNQIALDDAYQSVPYDVNYIWRMFNAGKQDDVLEAQTLTPKRVEKIRKTLFRLAGVTERTKSRMIEKTVSNCLRIPFIEKVFPDAKYVHLVRDGRAVAESAHRMWMAPPDRGSLIRKLRDLPISQYDYLAWFALNYAKGLFHGRQGGAVWGPRYPGIMIDINSIELLEIVAKQWKYSVEFALRDISSIDNSRKFFMRYEDLASDTQKVEALCDFLGVSNRQSVINSIAAGFNSSNLEKWRKSLSTEEVSVIETVAAAELRELGYLEK